MSHNNSIREIAWRQHTAGRPNSFFKKINDILDMYQLPSFNEIMNQHYNKLDWKNIVRTAISSHWTVKLKADCEEKSTLKLLSKRNLNIGQTHNVWDTISSPVKDVRKAATKVRMLTGTYMLQTLKVKFIQAEIDPTCPICKLEAEDLQHLLTSCPAYRHIRKSHFQQIKEYVVSKIGNSVWTINFNNKMAITELLIDCQSLVERNILPNDKMILRTIEMKSRDYCHLIHMKRMNITNV
ncbi:unnamed protein product [Mytilus coruscus]|uniref:Reverse transcriptase zinc-binding domain-containing protein n=1 Tax=Mytilus coruscus TaxID=42192 RepID=A0A6J8B3A3_MYTCO|nr:unnamed protein product [Mytilus coruscus]